MATLRARLTVAYGFALVGCMIVFAIALYFARSLSGPGELGPLAYEQADQIIATLHSAKDAGIDLTVERPCPEQREGRCVYASPKATELLERVPGYFLVFDPDDRQL